MLVLRAVIGLMLVLVGSQLYWLFAGGIFFLYGSALAAQFGNAQSPFQTVIVSLVNAFVGVLISTQLKKLMALLCGFLAGFYLSFGLPSVFGFQAVPIPWWVALLAGAAAAGILALSYSWSMMLLSPLSGATLMAQSISPAWIDPRLVFISMLMLGIIVQLIMWQYSEPSLEK